MIDKLNCETEPPFVGPPWKQGRFVSGERPQVLCVWIVQRICHGKPGYELRSGILWSIGSSFW